MHILIIGVVGLYLLAQLYRGLLFISKRAEEQSERLEKLMEDQDGVQD